MHESHSSPLTSANSPPASMSALGARSQCAVNAQWTYYSLGGDSLRFYGPDTNSTAHHIWNWGDGANSSGVTVTNHHYTSPGTYHVCYYVYIPGSSCSDSLCQSVTVAPPPCNLNTAWSYTDMGGDSVHFAGADTNTANHHDWYFGDGTYSATNSTHPSHTYAQPGTYHVCLYVYIPAGCTDSLCEDIVVTGHDPCNITPDWFSYSLGGDSIRFYASDTNSAAHHLWNWGDASYSSGTTDTIHTYSASGTYHVCFYDYVPGGPCSDSLCRNVTVAAPACHATAAWSSSSLGGDSVRFYAADTNRLSHFYWTWGDGTSASGAKDTIHIYAAPGTYHVCLQMYIPGTTCSDSLCQYITIAGSVAPCNIRYGWTYSSAGGDSATFSAEDTVSAAHHIWNWGDGTNSASNTTHTSHVYSQPGTYHVCFYVYIPGTTCSDSFCQNVTIVSSSPCHVSAAWSTYALGGDSARFYGPDTNSAAHHIWVWGDGRYTSGATVTNHSYSLPGTYHVCYYVYIPGTDCTDSLCDNVTVGTGGAASTCAITAAWTYYSVSGDSIRFHAADTSSTAHHIWTFGDGTYAAATTTPLHVYTQPGTYHVCFYAYIPGTTCSDSSCSMVTIAPAATPPCTTTAEWVSYAGTGDTVRFYASDTNSAAHHIWTWGDGTYTSGATASTHVFAGAGTYHVCFYVYVPGTNCSDSLCNDIVVGGNPCHISALWAAYPIGGDSVRFYSADTNTAAHHIWVWGDGSYTSGVTNSIHMYSDTGTYHVCYYVYIPGTGCTDSLCGDVTISAGGRFELSAVWSSDLLGGDTVGFTATDTNGTAYVVWSFGDGTYAFNTNNPAHIYGASGTYTVCLYTFIPGTAFADTVCQTVTVAVLGISNVSDPNKYLFNLYPNPTNSIFTITTDYKYTLSIHILNLLGEKLRTFTMTGSRQTLDISDLASGIYEDMVNISDLASGIYEVQISDGEQTLKVIKVVKE
ncbi:unnamed protein product [Sphagnum balticum]